MSKPERGARSTLTTDPRDTPPFVLARNPSLQRAKPCTLLPIWRSRAPPAIPIRANHILIGRAKQTLARAIEYYGCRSHEITRVHPIRRIVPHRDKPISRLLSSRQALIQQARSGRRPGAWLRSTQVRQGLRISTVTRHVRHFRLIDRPDRGHSRSLVRMNLRRRHTRNRDRRNNQNDRNHDQHFKQGESIPMFHLASSVPEKAAATKQRTVLTKRLALQKRGA